MKKLINKVLRYYGYNELIKTGSEKIIYNTIYEQQKDIIKYSSVQKVSKRELEHFNYNINEYENQIKENLIRNIVKEMMKNNVIEFEIFDNKMENTKDYYIHLDVIKH